MTGLRELTEPGGTAPEWRDAFLAVPRHLFIPDTIWRDDGERLVPVHKADDPASWREMCDADGFVVTQVDDGEPAGPGLLGDEITSSSSRPDVVALMLAALGAEPGMDVLEIGTGTGWNAALLAERLGAGSVTTIEVDPSVAERAHRALREAGYKVAAVVGDGTYGYPPGAPYDRVLATAAARQIPYAWIEQVRPGGRVVVPWASDFHNGALLSLTVSADGVGTGRIVGNVAFMPLRGQRGRRVSLDDVQGADDARVSMTELHPYDVLGDYDASLAIGLKVPRCKSVVENHDDGAYTLWFVDPWSGAWARLRCLPGADAHEIRQFGGRDLWDEVEAAYRWWSGLGRPDAGRWEVTVTPGGQRVGLTG